MAGAGKTKRPRRKPLPSITTRNAPWGATKQAADCFEKIRTLKNRVHELEQELIASGTKDTSWHPTGTEIAALRKLLEIPVFLAQEAGILVEMFTVTRMCVRLTKWNTERLRAATHCIRAEDDGSPAGILG